MSIVRKCNGNIFVVDIDLSKSNGFKFRRK